jgi:hypothetical protein
MLAGSALVVLGTIGALVRQATEGCATGTSESDRIARAGAKFMKFGWENPLARSDPPAARSLGPGWGNPAIRHFQTQQKVIGSEVIGSGCEPYLLRAFDY